MKVFTLQDEILEDEHLVSFTEIDRYNYKIYGFRIGGRSCELVYVTELINKETQKGKGTNFKEHDIYHYSTKATPPKLPKEVIQKLMRYVKGYFTEMAENASWRVM